MRRLFVAGLFFSSTLTPVFAETISFDSTVLKATVFPQGAEVTRLASGPVPAGEHVITIKDLPGEIVKSSVRVEGTSPGGIEIGSVDVSQVYIPRAQDLGSRKKIEEEIGALKDQLAALSQDIQNAHSQRKLLNSLALRAIAPRRDQNGNLTIDSEQLGKLLDTTGSRLSRLSAIIGKAQIQQRKRQRKIAELQQKLAEQAPNQYLQTVVKIHLNAQTAGVSKFAVRYNVSEAGWTPVYDAKLHIGEKGKNSSVKLVRRANVRQATTDNWENISLTLSTARPGGRTKPPVLSPYILRVQPRPIPMPSPMTKTKRYKTRMAPKIAMEVQGSATMADSVPVRRQTVKIVFAGFLAEYKIPGKVTVSNKSAEKNVIIDTDDFNVDLAALVAPRLDSKAYLTAKFKLQSKAPFLPGPVMLFRDGVFLGKTKLPLLNPGQSYKLSFGADNFIKVKRRKIARKTGESGFISKSRVETRNFATTIKNRHDFTMPIVVVDQLPYATHEDIQVSTLPGSTAPSRKNIDKKRGILAWDFDLAANAEKVIKFGYQVTWPKDMIITPVR
jgi:uncharacterized protein (TIGR02231 family)